MSSGFASHEGSLCWSSGLIWHCQCDRGSCSVRVPERHTEDRAAEADNLDQFLLQRTWRNEQVISDLES